MTLLFGCKQLNSAKTEMLWCAPSLRQHQISQSGTRIGADDVVPSAFVRDLEIYINADVSMRTHVAKTLSSCLPFYVIFAAYVVLFRNRSCNQSLVVALVLTRLDF